jgi:hypothetical protein
MDVADIFKINRRAVFDFEDNVLDVLELQPPVFICISPSILPGKG